MSAPIQRRIDAALGKIECDLLIRDVRYLDVFSCSWKVGDVATIDGVIVGVEPGLKAKREISAKNLLLVPGFIDAHVHLESSMVIPPYFQNLVLPRGTTTAICDPHELANVIGPEGISYFLKSAEKLDLNLQVMLSSCVPATHLETNGGGAIYAESLLSLSNHPHALGLAEMMNMPGVLNLQPDVIEKLEKFSQFRIDGHAPLMKGRELSAYVAAGISSCHESSELGEAKEKLTKGMAVWIREGSVAKDLQELLPILSLETSTSVGFCTDDRNPLDILTEGHVDYLVRGAMKRGVDPCVTYRSASWSVARHYGLDRGPQRIGAIAPGYLADLILLEDERECSIREVFKSGKFASELDLPQKVDQEIKDTVRAKVPEVSDLQGPKGSVHVIIVEEGKIVTGREIARNDAEGVAHLSVLERYGHFSKPANGYVRGFGSRLQGAIASSVGHDSHNLIVVGSSLEDMKTALRSLIECGGGFSVAQNQNVIAKLALPFGGLMSSVEPQVLEKSLRELKKASQQIGCVLQEPFLQLAFLSLPVIPTLKLTDKGLVDVDRFELISVSV